MDLSTPPLLVRVDCEVCGRLFNHYEAGIGLHSDGRETFIFDLRLAGREGKDWMVGPGRLERGGRVTGRHRERRIRGRNGEPALGFECGCGHRRTISYAALSRKVADAPEPRIRL